VLANLPVVRSMGARTVLLGSASFTLAIALWTNNLTAQQTIGLTPIFIRLFILDNAGANCSLLLLVAAMFIGLRRDPRPLMVWICDRVVPIAGGTFLTLCLGSLFIYRSYPLSLDEYCALFQSQVFASGHLAGQFPPELLDWLIPKPFQSSFLFVSPVTGQVASAYWPSFMTPFTFLGIPWACNPAISALTLIVIRQLALRIFADRATAGLAVLLTAASPVFMADGISYYAMAAHLLANAVFALLLLEPTAKRACLAGLVGSVALTLHQPIPHMFFALPWIIWLVRRREGIALTGWLIVGYLPLCVLFGIGWFLFSTHLPHEGLVEAAAGNVANRFVARTGSLFVVPPASLLMARLIGIAKTAIWAVPGLLLLAGAGAWKWRHDRYCRLLILAALITLFGYLFIPADQGHGWGFRYFHSAWLALPLLAAAALQGTPGSTHPAASKLFEDHDTRTSVVACALLTLTFGNAWHGYQIRDFISMNLEQVPPHPDSGKRVVIIDPTYAFYGWDLVRNDPWLRGDSVMMITQGRAQDAEMMRRHFPQLRKSDGNIRGTVWTESPPGPDR
jgi:hypothetical protein